MVRRIRYTPRLSTWLPPTKPTKTEIQDLPYDINFCTSSKTPFYVCFKDFEKTFDCISRKKLMLKLSKLGCTSQILAVLSDISRMRKFKYVLATQKGGKSNKQVESLKVINYHPYSSLFFLQTYPITLKMHTAQRFPMPMTSH